MLNRHIKSTSISTVLASMINIYKHKLKIKESSTFIFIDNFRSFFSGPAIKQNVALKRS